MLAKTKQWGNSLAVLIPKIAVDTLGLRPNEPVSISIERPSTVLKELFGSISFTKPTEQLLRDARKNTSKWE